MYAIMFKMFEYIQSIRPDLLENNFFTDTFYEKCIDFMYETDMDNNFGTRFFEYMKYGEPMPYGEGIGLEESDFSYTLFDILEMMKTIKKENKYTLPYGFSIEATKDIVVGDLVSFEYRG